MLVVVYKQSKLQGVQMLWLLMQLRQIHQQSEMGESLDHQQNKLLQLLLHDTISYLSILLEQCSQVTQHQNLQ